MKSFNNELLEKNNKKPVVLSDRNHLLLKKLGYQLESDTMNETISKILAKIPGVYEIDVNETKT